MSGVCLTVTRAASNCLEFEVVRETLDKSTLGSKHVGAQVNLERSLRVGDRLDGHFVQGHVDGQAKVDRMDASSKEHVIWFRLDVALAPFVIPKGSIAIDGVSLTVASLDGDRFSVALIPTTLARTTLSVVAVGDAVNVETDILARTIVHQLRGSRASAALSLEMLQEKGFA